MGMENVEIEDQVIDEDESVFDEGKPDLPPVPDKEHLLSIGWREDEADVIVSHMAAIHEKITELNLPPKETMIKPGLKIVSKRPKGFWICGRCVKAGSAWEVPCEQLNKNQMLEIETAKKGEHIAVEEIELEVEVE